MPIAQRIALSFLALKAKEFTFTVHRRELGREEQSHPGTRFLPVDPLANDSPRSTFRRYVVDFAAREGFERTEVRAWLDPDLTTMALYQALADRVRHEDLLSRTELSEKKFIREVAFVLHREDDAREVMWLRAYCLRALGRFGFICSFALRVKPDSVLPAKRRLELSLTHKNGRVNEDFFLDRYQKVAEFLRLYFGAIKNLRLHDGTEVELEHKLSLVPSFTLAPRTFVFGGRSEGRNQFFGLRDHEPLQAPRESARLVFFFQANDRSKSQDLFRALRGDTYSTFPGMERMFRVPIGRDNVSGMEVPDFSNEELRRACLALREEFPNERLLPVALVPLSKNSSDEETLAYHSAKHAFLSLGFASQFIDRKRLDDRNALKWSISNIGLALFAKMGGVPWEVKPSTEKCLIVGIGQAHRVVEGKTEKYVAYSVLTDSSGVNETIKVLGNSSDREEYLRSLKSSLRSILMSHREYYRSFVLHVTFSMKREETDAIRVLIEELRQGAGDCEFIVLKFNDHNDFFGFSVDHNSRVPYEGTVAKLSKREFLVWFSGIGIADSKAPKKPERPVHVRVLYPDAPMDESDLRRLLQDSFNIAGANWRGFNAKSLPISIYYAELIARYYSYFRQAGLPEVDMDNLPPWFL